MQSSLVRRSSRVLLVLAVFTVAACGDREIGASLLKKTHAGMPRDSVVELLGNGVIAATGADTVRVVNGHHRQIFFINGKNVEVIWFRESPGSVNDRLTKEVATPVVFTDNKLAGWGWKFYNGEGAKLGLKDPDYTNPGPLPAPVADTAK